MPEYSVSWGASPEPGESRELEVLEERAWFPPHGSSSLPMNFWQGGLDSSLPRREIFSAIYACRKVISEEVSRLDAYHYERDGRGGEQIKNSRINRVLRYPNTWQSRVDFWLNMLDFLLRNGSAYALASRDRTGAIEAFTQLRTAAPHIDPETGMVFYGVGVDSQTPRPDGTYPDPQYLIPADDVLHLRLFTPVHPLIGETPLVAAAMSADTGLAISGSTYSLFNRAARPGGYLKHPRRIKKETRDRLRAQWERTYSGMGTGGTAILEEGLEWVPMTMTAVDAEIVSQYKLTVEEVARVFRVPLFMLGNMDRATFSNVEQMTRSFYAGCLGFYLALIEEGLARFFDLPMNETIRFDVEAGLMRAEFRDRIEGLVRGVQGGVFAPNEARRREGYPEVLHGDKPLVQQQMVPLDYAAQQTAATSAPAPAEPEAIDENEIRQMVLRELKVAA